MAHATGTLEGTVVLVRDGGQVDRLQAKGSYGVRVKEGLALDIYEAAHLVEQERLEVHRPGETTAIPMDHLLALGARELDRFETEHLSFRDLRSRGYVARRRDDHDLDAWERGTAPPRQKPSMLVAARGEAEPASPSTLDDLITRARGLGRKLLVSVVDEESDVTYYDVDEATILGQVPDPAPELAHQARAVVLRERAVLLEAPEGLQEAGYGHEAGDQVFLSLAEAHHLCAHGMAAQGIDADPLSPDDIRDQVQANQPGAEHAIQAYAWLRERELVPKTGFKFGVHFRVYRSKPNVSHAPFLVQALDAEASWTFRDLARFVRLSHSVKKQPVLWSQAGGVMVEWTRP